MVQVNKSPIDYTYPSFHFYDVSFFYTVSFWIVFCLFKLINRKKVIPWSLMNSQNLSIQGGCTGICSVEILFKQMCPDIFLKYNLHNNSFTIFMKSLKTIKIQDQSYLNTWIIKKITQCFATSGPRSHLYTLKDINVRNYNAIALKNVWKQKKSCLLMPSC